ncbi:MAG: AhpC/TSA family protein [Gammaproteobacteria bacterium]|nr:AhpC/TSA family protein [Gammaproteobacteria bacterium]MDH5592839.1 AhpC/TSA family protein [Gammaproteobacteria bacterium]MDH5614219.1 AhpC/TSA family protein [Gammaproteobacteria bacterium]
MAQKPVTLAEQNQQLMTDFMNQLPQEQQAIVQHEMGKIISDGCGNEVINTGDVVPDFSLVDVHGGDFRLYEMLQKGPVVISFYRGGWCPFCTLEFKALMDIYPQVNAAGAELVAISPQTHHHSVLTATDLSIPFPVLSDPGNQVTRRFGLLFKMPEAIQVLYKEWGLDVPRVNGSDNYDLPIPATYIVGTDGKVKEAYININYTERMEPAEILAFLKKLNT